MHGKQKSEKTPPSAKPKQFLQTQSQSTKTNSGQASSGTQLFHDQTSALNHTGISWADCVKKSTTESKSLPVLSNAMPKSREIKFHREGTQVYSETQYKAGLKIIENGDLPPEIRDVIQKIKGIIFGVFKKNKMCSIYLINNDGKFNIYVAVSGYYTKNSTQNFNLLKNAIDQCRDLSEIVTLVPFSRERVEIREEDDDPHEILDREELFIKFLITTVSYYAWEGQENEYNKLKIKFSLDEKCEKKIANIKKMINDKEVRDAYKKYKDYVNNQEIPMMEFISQVFFQPREILPKQLEMLKDSPIRIEVYDIERKSKKDPYEHCLGLMKKHTEGINEEKINLLYENLKFLWDHLKEDTNFEISHKLTHCAESNLMDYLHRNQKTLSKPGDHYLFNFKIAEPEIQLFPFCDICKVNVPQHLRNLHAQTGKSTDYSFQAFIPVKRVTVKELEEWENEEKLIREIDAQEEHNHLVNKEGDAISLQLKVDSPEMEEFLEIIDPASEKHPSLVNKDQATVNNSKSAECLIANKSNCFYWIGSANNKLQLSESNLKDFLFSDSRKFPKTKVNLYSTAQETEISLRQQFNECLAKKNGVHQGFIFEFNISDSDCRQLFQSKEFEKIKENILSIKLYKRDSVSGMKFEKDVRIDDIRVHKTMKLDLISRKF